MPEHDEQFQEGLGLGENVQSFSPNTSRTKESAGLAEDVTIQNVSNSRIFVSVDGADWSDRVNWESLGYSKNKGGNRDTFTFSMKNPEAELEGLEDIQIKYGETFETAEAVFGGFVTSTEQYFDGLLKIQAVSGADYSWKLDKKLVMGVFSGSIQEIIADIFDGFVPEEFTIGSVDGTGEIDSIRFNYIPVSEAITEICELFLLEWKVDTQKRLNIVQSDKSALVLEDENDSHVWNSLRLTNDLENIKNSIIVRGGEFVSKIETEENLDSQADGENSVLKLGYRYQSPKVFYEKGTINERQLTLGLDNIDNILEFEVLYNVQEKVLRFPEDAMPSAADSPVVFTGFRRIPVRIAISDSESIEDLGTEFEFLIIDRSIESQETALEKARAELEKYASSIKDIQFTTYKDFLDVSQAIRLVSPLRGVDEEFVITGMNVRAVDPFKFLYNVTGVTIKKMNFIDMMKKILLSQAKNLIISEDEVLTVIESFEEVMTIEEGEFFFNVDQEYTWVAGLYVPEDEEDTNRSIRTDTGANVQS
jgi:hypothetical protein